MSEPDVAAWTRQQVEARKAIAEAATCGVSWEAEGDDPTDDEVWIDVDGQGWRLAILRGPQSHENMLHVAANDPRSVIAQCEAELAILDACRRGIRNGRAFLAEEIVRLLATGYRHCEGYQEAWNPAKADK